MSKISFKLEEKENEYIMRIIYLDDFFRFDANKKVIKYYISTKNKTVVAVHALQNLELITVNPFERRVKILDIKDHLRHQYEIPILFLNANEIEEEIRIPKYMFNKLIDTLKESMTNFSEWSTECFGVFLEEVKLIY